MNVKMKTLARLLQVNSKRSAFFLLVGSIIILTFSVINFISAYRMGGTATQPITLSLIALWICIIALFGFVSAWCVFSKSGQQVLSDQQAKDVGIVRVLFACFSSAFVVLMLAGLLLLPLYGFEFWLTVFSADAPIYLGACAIVISPIIRRYLKR